MSKNKGGPAFPLHNDTVIGVCVERGDNPEGMTLRDYFAGQAMQALMTCEYTNGQTAPTCDAAPEEISRWAYMQADAMIKEGKK